MKARILEHQAPREAAMASAAKAAASPKKGGGDGAPSILTGGATAMGPPKGWFPSLRARFDAAVPMGQGRIGQLLCCAVPRASASGGRGSPHAVCRYRRACRAGGRRGVRLGRKSHGRPGPGQGANSAERDSAPRGPLRVGGSEAAGPLA